MGNQLCCSEKETPRSRIKVVSSKNKHSDQKVEYNLPEASSTSDSDTQNYLVLQETPKPPKIESFKSYIRQREFEMSSIKKISESCGDCCEQKVILSYLQKLEKEMDKIKGQNCTDLQSLLIEKDENYKLDEKRFIEHSSKCPICYQLFQNLRNMENQQIQKTQIPQMENRISLRDSLLDSQQCEKAKRSAECKCQILNSHQEAKKAMLKYHNTNNYQIKRLKFRKTSTFEPQIKEARESQQSLEV